MKKKKTTANKSLSILHRSNKSISLLLFLIFLFGISSVVFTESRQATLEEQRKLIYGSWHIAVYDTDTKIYQTIKNHATVKSAGCMYLYGYTSENTVDFQHDFSGSIGYADDNMIEIGNITLLEGRLPETKNEIAVEASCLNQMGYSYELGQQISIAIFNENEKDRQSNMIHHLKLCGVIKNYSSYWKTGSYILPSILISSEFAAKLTNPTIHVFAEMKPEFAAEADSLSLLCKSRNTFTKNEFTYLQYSTENDPSLQFLFQQIMILLTCFLFIVILINVDIRQRYNSFVMMRTIGASKLQIILFFLREKRIPTLTASLLGIICGLLFPCLVSLLINEFSTYAVSYSFHIKNVIFLILLLYSGLALSFMIGLITLFQIPLRGIPKQQALFQKTYTHRKKSLRYSLFFMFRAVDRRQKFFQTILTFIATTLIYSLAYQTWDTYRIYSQYQSDYPHDYSFGLLAAYSPPESVMSEESLEQIEQTYGVKEVRSFSVSDYYAISFSSAYDQQYAKEVSAYLSRFVTKVPTSPVCGAFIGISDNLLPLFMNELDSGTSAKTLAQDEIILYLPDYYKQPDGSFLIQEDEKKASSKSQRLSEHTISVGDTLQITIHHVVKKLKIVGIIRSFEYTTPLSCNPMRPYSIICSQNTYKKITGQNDYAYILVFRDTASIPYQTDVELSKLQTGLYFNNNRTERLEQTQNLFLQMILSMLFCISVFLVIIILHFNVYFLYEKQKANRYRFLYQLGMSKSMIRKYLSANTLLHCIFGVLFSVAAFLIFHFIQEGMALLSFDDYKRSGFFQFLFDTSIRFLHYTEWQFLLVFGTGIFILNFLILWIHEYHFLKNNIQII